MTFATWADGGDQPARAFTDPPVVQFPPPIGGHYAYLFPFSDQVLYPCTLAVRTAVTRLAIEPAWLANVLSIMTRTGASRLVAVDWVCHAIGRTRRDRPSTQGARFALRVDVRRGSHSRYATLVSCTQADAAAAGAAGVVRLLVEGRIPEPGA